MLSALSISDIVLIDDARLELSGGFIAMTGETGAGKSIVLDALGLALGGRAERAQLRHGAKKGWAAASFQLDDHHAVFALLREADIDVAPGEELTLRRTLARDGRTRCFVNDMPVSAGLLRQIGDALVEVHGQHDGRGLLNRAHHRALLDDYGNLDDLTRSVRDAFEQLQTARAALDAFDIDVQRLAAEAQHISDSLAELDALAPEAGEEERLAEERRQLQQVSRMTEALQATWRGLQAEDSFEDQLGQAYRSLEPFLEVRGDGDPLARAARAIDRVMIELDEAREALGEAITAIDLAPERLEAVEARLFALRAAARKHGVSVENLVELRERYSQASESVEASDARRARLKKALGQSEVVFGDACCALSDARTGAAAELDARVNAELEPLKLGRARFRTSLQPLEESRWNGHGAEQVSFEVETNPGAGFGPLGQIASGGELSRFALALRVALAARGGSHVFIFDEIDQGVGGSTADAIGKRLARLGEHSQVLVVTHSPQVASKARMQIQIEKADRVGNADTPALVTRLQVLEGEARELEIARMLAGETVTPEARAAARALLQVSAA